MCVFFVVVFFFVFFCLFFFVLFFLLFANIKKRPKHNRISELKKKNIFRPLDRSHQVVALNLCTHNDMWGSYKNASISTICAKEQGYEKVMYFEDEFSHN